jgi:hypothetical protein
MMGPKHILAVAVLILTIGSASARAQATAEASAEIVRAITLAQTEELRFGSLMPGSGGTVTVSELNVQSVTGGVTALAGGFSAGTFYVQDLENKGNRKFSFTFLDPTITLTRQAGTETMSVTNFTSTALKGQPWSRASTHISVGATLTIAPNQVPGVYVGTYRVRVDEQ